MNVRTKREKVRFISGDTQCAAWHYPGTNGACVITAGGRGDQGAGHRPVREVIPRGRVRCPGLRLPPSWGERTAAGPGRPHQGAAHRLAGRDRVRRPAGSRPGQVSRSAPLPVRRRLPRRGAQPAARRGDRADAERRWPSGRAQRGASPDADCDAAPDRQGHRRRLGGLAGRQPLLVPLADQPGTVALLTTPDGRDGDRALNPGNRYPDWQQTVAARPRGLGQPGSGDATEHGRPLPHSSRKDSWPR